MLVIVNGKQETKNERFLYHFFNDLVKKYFAKTSFLDQNDHFFIE
jgi:hypothetical protein